MQIMIAPAAVADAGEVLTVQRAAYVSEAQLYGDPQLPPLTETLERATLVAGTGHIGRLAVVPDLQGRGIGRQLLSAVEAALVAGQRTAAPGRAGAGLVRFELFTGAHSEANLRLYRRHGYTVVEHRPAPPGPGLVFLRKPVGAA